jgi:hypothetical protein
MKYFPVKLRYWRTWLLWWAECYLFHHYAKFLSGPGSDAETVVTSNGVRMTITARRVTELEAIAEVFR